MTRMHRMLLVLHVLPMALGLLVATPAAGQTPVDWEMHVTALDPGHEIDLRTASSKLRGRVVSVDGESITLKHRGRELRLLAADVDSIERVDRVWNGTAIGFTAGFATGAAMMLTCEPGFLCEHSAEAVLACGGLAGAFGAGVGLLLDAIVRGDRTVFRRAGQTMVGVAPDVRPGHAAMAVRVRF